MTDLDTPVWTLGDRLRKAREHAGLNQQEMADALGVTRGTLAGYEHDVREPRRAVVVAVSQLTGVAVEWLEGVRSR